jgi:hypothetical protein
MQTTYRTGNGTALKVMGELTGLFHFCRSCTTGPERVLPSVHPWWDAPDPENSVAYPAELPQGMEQDSQAVCWSLKGKQHITW